MSEVIPDLVDAKEIITGVISRSLDALLAPLEGAIRKRIAETRNRSEQLLHRYLTRKYNQIRSVKSLVHVGAPEDIRRISVASSFNHKGLGLGEDEFLTSIKEMPRRVIIGTAGAGKSFFMRHTFVNHFQSGRLGIPLYVELRTLNENASSIFDYLIKDIAHSDERFMSEQLSLGLKHGIFTLFLDGLDELNPSRFQSVQNDIGDLAEKYDGARMLVTSRPVDGPASWSKFWLFRLAPIDYAHSRLLVQKSGLSQGIQESFLDVLTPEFYSEHSGFLQIPLLVIVMALVFREQREISTSITTFYEDTYAALLSRHDATKEYKRLFYSGLDRTSFRAVLNNLSARTYGQFKYDFHETELLSLIREAAIAANTTLKPEDYLTDLITSVCMIVRDGFVLKYSHRSFQEYFCACFICALDGDNGTKLLYRIGLRHDAGEVLRFVREANRDLFEVGWLLPSVKAVRDTVFGDQNADLVTKVTHLVDIRVHERQAKYDVLPTLLGRTLTTMEDLEECAGKKDTISRIRDDLGRAYRDLDEAAHERNVFGLENPRQYPGKDELLATISADGSLSAEMSGLSEAIERKYEELTERKRTRDASMDAVFKI